MIINIQVVAAKEFPDCGDRPHSPSMLPAADAMDVSHISVAATLEPVDTPTRVLYSGSALLKQNTDLTPCKFHRGTPPLPATLNAELREVLSQKILI